MMLKEAIRALRSPAFAGLVVMTIALGVGPLAAIVSVVDRLFVRPLPYPRAERLVVLNEVDRRTPEVPEAVSFPNLVDWEEASRSFENLAGVYADPNFDVNLTGGSEPERVPVARVTWDYFDVLGVEPILGRTFLPEEDQVGRHRVLLLSHGLWERQFGSDPEILERTVEVNGFAYQVVGVLPASYRPVAKAAFGEDAELWRPVAASEEQRATRDWRFLQVVGRLAEGVGLADARREMDDIARRRPPESSEEISGRSIRVETLRRQVVGEIRSLVFGLLGGAIVLLLIACVNVAGLVLLRSLRRRQGLALRAALGASPAALFRLTVVETLGVILPGIALGILLGWLGTPLLLELAPREVPFVEAIVVDSRVALLAATVTAAVAFLASLLPAASLFGLDLRSELQGGEFRSGGELGGHLRFLLVGGQIAMAVVLLVSAALIGRSLMALTAVDPGFEAGGVLTLQLELPMVTRYPEQRERDAFFDELLGRLGNRSDVVATGRASVPPMGEAPWTTSFRIPGHPFSGEDLDHQASLMLADPGFFRTLRIEILQGRNFDSRDRPDAPRVVLVNRALADRYWPDGVPPGETLTLGFGSPEPYGIIGVVEDTHLRELDAPPGPAIYWPPSQHTHNFLTLFLRTTGDPEALVPVVRGTVASMDPQQPVYNVRPLSGLLSDAARRQRFATSLFGAMAILSMTLAGVGLFGTVSHTVRDQRREIGIRLALGSSQSTEVARVLHWSLRLVAGGLIAGLLGGWLASAALSDLVYGVGRSDPATFLGVASVMLGVSVLAALVPALHAARIDPLESIRR